MVQKLHIAKKFKKINFDQRFVLKNLILQSYYLLRCYILTNLKVISYEITLLYYFPLTKQVNWKSYKSKDSLQVKYNDELSTSKTNC